MAPGEGSSRRLWVQGEGSFALAHTKKCAGKKVRPRVVMWRWAILGPARPQGGFVVAQVAVLLGCEGSSWLQARGPRVGCGRPTGR